jgi:hypothetical protein
VNCACCRHSLWVIDTPPTQCVVVPFSSDTISCHSVSFPRTYSAPRHKIIPPPVIVSDRALRVVRGDYSPILARVVESLTAAIEFGAYPVNGTCPLLTHTQTLCREIRWSSV